MTKESGAGKSYLYYPRYHRGILSVIVGHLVFDDFASFPPSKKPNIEVIANSQFVEGEIFY